MNRGDLQQIAFAIVIFVVVALFVRALLNRNNDKDSKFALEELLLGDDGKTSKAAAVLMGAFVATTAVLLFQAWKGSLTDMTYAAYLAAWVAPTVTRLIVNGKPADAAS